MTSSNPAPEATPSQPEPSIDASTPTSNASMQEYYQLQNFLLSVTLILTGIIFISVWIFYSLNIALNYLLGAIAGVVYLRLLARNVERLGRDRGQIGKTQLAVLIGVIILASQWNQLHILPVFLGFLTYKAAIIVYMFKTLSTSSS